MNAALYARVSTMDQKTLAMQMKELRLYAKRRGWKIVSETSEVGSGVVVRKKRQEVMDAARRKHIDAILVWRLDRWGRSLADLIGTLTELKELDVAFVSVTEALDLSTSAGRALVGMLSVFAEFERDILSERIRAGIAEAKKEGRPHGRPVTAGLKGSLVQKLHKQGLNNSEIARRLKIGRASVVRMLAP